MSKAEWGVKRRCASCGAPFYDMQRDPISCPKCGAAFVAAALASSTARAPRRSRSMRAYVAPSIDTPVAEAEPDEVETLDADEEEADVEADEEDAVEKDEVAEEIDDEAPAKR